MPPKRTITAFHHQGERAVFRNVAGNQCTAIALAFLVLSLLSHVEKWLHVELDHALVQGTYLYQNIIQTYFSSAQFHLTYHLDELFGILSQNNNAHNDNYSVNISTAITVARTMSPRLILTIGQTTIAIVTTSHSIYVLDSHSRNTNGRPVPNGTAVALSFNTQVDLVEYLLSTYRNQQCILTPVEVRKEPHSTEVSSNHSYSSISNNHTYSSMLPKA